MKTLLLICFFLFASSFLIEAKVIYVKQSTGSTTDCGSTSRPCKDLKSAMKMAEGGDTIVMKPGKLTGSGNRNVRVEQPDLIITGESKQSGKETIIDLGSVSGYSVFILHDNNTVLKDFEIWNVNKKSVTGAAVEWNADVMGTSQESTTLQLWIENVKFKNCQGGAVLLFPPEHPDESEYGTQFFLHTYITGCKFLDAKGKGPAVFARQNTLTDVESCVFRNLNGGTDSYSSHFDAVDFDSKGYTQWGIAIRAVGNSDGNANFNIRDSEFIGNRGFSIIHVGDDGNTNDNADFRGNTLFTDNIADYSILSSSSYQSDSHCYDDCTAEFSGNEAPPGAVCRGPISTFHNSLCESVEPDGPDSPDWD